MTHEQRIARLETMIAEIHAVLIGGDSPQDRPGGNSPRIDGVDAYAYKRAIKELARGNPKPLDLYMKRGGKIPKGKPEKR